jgi:hypothetical protein
MMDIKLNNDLCSNDSVVTDLDLCQIKFLVSFCEASEGQRKLHLALCESTFTKAILNQALEV